MLRVAVLGAGAIGGVIAARMALAGHATTVVARGAHLQAIEATGLRFREGDRDILLEVATARDAAAIGDADLLFICVKAHDFEAATRALDPALLGSAIVVPVLNGLPWWYRPPGQAAPLRATDPDAVLAARFSEATMVAAVAHFAADVPEPGTVRQTAAGRLVLGALDGCGEAIAAVRDAFRGEGLEIVVATDIAREIWIKLAGNVAFNPVSALTGATMAEICANADLLAIVRRAMSECMETGTRCGITFPLSPNERIEMARAIGGSKLSMLQDIERGRPIEADAIIGAVAEIGRLKRVPTPTIDMLQALVGERALRAHSGRQT
ncbi:ketopantoate reductase family protein [Nitratireductor pacificus]|uniref:2-dehydropantoate 2-reductase n=1 Tax=Nitratireductor pacificus pht-3B TaxID=391937 RepID=K2M7E3_9HYPH|nr:2-dehydropantoate 2-reductase [Nitratireductor pacificus]EKF18096.1 2-dehydropantoate 2-reductase [Nitratireductor pacificus pht-3B]